MHKYPDNEILLSTIKSPIMPQKIYRESLDAY